MASQSSSQPPNTLVISLFFVFIFIVLPPSAESLSFRFPRFNPNTTNVVYEGDATNFSFIIDTQNKSVGNYGHGIVVFLASMDSEIPPNSMGGFLGLFNTTTLLSPSNNNITGVEFDSFSNPEWDPPGEHVGFIVNSLKSSQHVSWNTSMHNLDVANAHISYKSRTKKMNLLLMYNDSPSRYNVSLDIDLRKTLPEWVKIGFSTATGAATEVHRILSWEFSSTLEGKEIIDANTSRNKHGNLKLILGLSIPFGTMVAATILLWVILKRSKTKVGEDQGGDQGVVLTSINGSFDRALEIISRRIRR